MPADELPPLADELDLLTEAVRAAGAVAMQFHRRSPRTWSKANDSPVTEADIAVEAMLLDYLGTARPGYGWLSEERDDDRSRLSARRTFIVDPIDGTRDFIAGGSQWTVPVAIVEAGRPVAAVLYAPVIGELYRASRGGGATRNGAPLRVSGRDSLPGAHIAGLRRLFQSPPLVERIPVAIEFFASLAYRLARVADGRLDAAFAKPDAQDWDLAAADLLVQEAGGLVTDLTGSLLRYDRAETGHPAIIAATPGIHDALAAAMREAMAALAADGATGRDSVNP